MQIELTGTYSASNFLIKRGVKLNLLGGYYRLSTKILNLFSIFSKHFQIPKPEYVLIFKTLYAKCESCEIEDFENGNGSVYQLSLVHHKSRRLIVDEGKNKDEILKKAYLLAQHYHLRIKDSATNRRQPVWL